MLTSLTQPSTARRVGPFLERDELDLYIQWLALPHPELQIAAHRARWRWVTPPWTPELAADVAFTITKEQEKNFALYVCVYTTREYFVLADWAQAQQNDIIAIMGKLQTFQMEIEGIAKELKQEMMEALDLDQAGMEERLRQDMARRA